VSTYLSLFIASLLLFVGVNILYFTRKRMLRWLCSWAISKGKQEQVYQLLAEIRKEHLLSFDEVEKMQLDLGLENTK
jgi:hypothetical protein